MSHSRTSGIWSDQAIRILNERYLMRDKDGNLCETPDEMLWRVARAVAEAELGYGSGDQALGRYMTYSEKFYDIMVEQKFLPNSPTLMNAGTGNGQQLSACFVLPIEDSIEGIFDAIKWQALIHKSGGGTGFSFSKLRPANSRVGSTQGVASGPVSFMKVFDAATEQIKQGGKRRGANMAVLRVDHPDILEFIECKLSGGINNFNISVGVTNEFMAALDGQGSKATGLGATDRKNYGYHLIDPSNGKVVETLNARDVWHRITKAAWSNGDPGLFFVDRANDGTANPCPNLYRIETTNPCFTGDTLIAVADGRVAVTIKTLAEEGDNVPVYCTDGSRVHIRIGRNPRLTREAVQVWKVTLDDGSTIRTTADHTFLLRDGMEIKLRDLKSGDSLMPFNKRIQTDGGWWINRNDGTYEPEYRMIVSYHIGSELKPYPNGFVSPVRENDHQVVSIEVDGFEDVYNLTVDDFHTVGIVTSTSSNDGGEIVSLSGVITRQCGETPLEDWGVCNLGSINLAKFCMRPTFTLDPRKLIDWNSLANTVRTATRFLDDVIDINPFPLQQITDMAKQLRRVGLGVMGWADLLYMLYIPYDSEEALQLADEIMSFISTVSHEASIQLARERGPFPAFQHSIYKDGPPIRNSTTTVIAPTGTISIMAGVSGGIEPFFALAYQHIVDHDKPTERKLSFVNPVFSSYLRNRFAISPDPGDVEIALAAVASTGSCQGLRIGGDLFPSKAKDVFKVANEIAPSWHVRMQAAFQKHTDSAISKTVNLPNSATQEDVDAIYRQAWDLGCLGITVYRDGSRQLQVLNAGTNTSSKTEPNTGSVVEASSMKPRARRTEGHTYRIETPLGTAYVTINRNGNNEPFEVFLNVGKAGSDTAAVSEALGRLMSLIFRLPSTLTPTERVLEVVEQLEGIGGSRPVGFGKDRIRSLPDGIASILLEDVNSSANTLHAYHEVTTGIVNPVFSREDTDDNFPPLLDQHRNSAHLFADLCPKCGVAAFVSEEGCQKCYSCGYSMC